MQVLFWNTTRGKVYGPTAGHTGHRNTEQGVKRKSCLGIAQNSHVQPTTLGRTGAGVGKKNGQQCWVQKNWEGVGSGNHCLVGYKACLFHPLPVNNTR